MILRLFLLLLVLHAAAGAAHGQQVEAAAAEPTITVMPVVINSIAAGDATVLLWPADVWVERTTLEQARLTIPPAANVQHDDLAMVALSRMRDDVSHRLTDTLELHLTVRPGAFAPQQFDLAHTRPAPAGADATSGGASLYMNYGVDWSTGARMPAVQAEAGFRKGLALVTATASRTATGALAWGGAQAAIDDERRLMRWTAGEQFTAGSLYQGARPFIGLTLSRAFDLNPYVVRHAAPHLEGIAATPSVVEIYANGALLRRQEVQPGVFHLAGIPTSAGAGRLDVVVRDGFGRTQAYSTDYYQAPSLLNRGQHEFAYSLGKRSLALTRLPGSGPLMASAFHRYGVTRSLTLGGRLDVTPDQLDLETSAGVRLPFAEIAMDAAVHRRDADSRGAVAVSLNRQARHASFGASLRMMEADFNPASVIPDPVRTLSSFISWNFSSVASLASRYTRQEWAAAPTCDEISVVANGRTGRRGNYQVTLAAACGTDGQRAAQVRVGYSLVFGQRASAHVTYGAEGMAVDVQRPLGIGRGNGYRLQASSAGRTMMEAQAVRGPGRYEVSYAAEGGGQRVSARASGSVVIAGGSVLFSRPVQDAFAVVRVPGLSGVRVYASGQEVGRTNARGQLLVPGLLPSYVNEVSIADQDVPLTHSIGKVMQVASPRRRGGVVLSFATHQRRGVTGLIRVAGTDAIPAYGELTLTVDGLDISSPITSDGLFYFDAVPPGAHRGTIQYDGGQCTVTIDVPDTSAEQTDVGTLPCTPAP